GLTRGLCRISMLPSRDRKGVGMALRAAEFNEDVSGEQARKINELQSVFNRVVTNTNCSQFTLLMATAFRATSSCSAA
ncbi:MAG TPA: hypothetical protein VFC21_11945, partial [Bryobacteraceae bacterium]|nr:hypothetical protein [Bryobacteraceae bacterium]